MKDSAKINIILLVLVLVVSCAICSLLIYNIRLQAPGTGGASGTDSGWDAKKQLDFAETLASKGLKKEALVAFEDYLKLARISAMESAKLLYRMGNMQMELFDYEKALYYFYKAEAADPRAGFKSELDKKLVECLENAGLNTQAQYELAGRAAVGADEEPVKEAAGGAVLAKVANKEITQREIDDAINNMPDWAKESFSQGEGKVEFVRQYATTQALYNKAKMLGLDQDSDVRRSIRDVTKQILVQKFLERELKGKVNLDPLDMQDFYEANKDKYKEGAAVKAGVIKFSKLQTAQDTARRLQVGADFAKMVKELSEDPETKGKDGLIEGGIEANGYIPGIGTSKEAADAIFSKQEGQFAGPFKINDSYYVFKINSIKPARQKSFEEIKDQIEYEYKNKKVQQEMQLLLKDIMEQEQVEVYSDRILGKDEEQNKPNQPN